MTPHTCTYLSSPQSVEPLCVSVLLHFSARLQFHFRSYVCDTNRNRPVIALSSNRFECRQSFQAKQRTLITMFCSRSQLCSLSTSKEVVLAHRTANFISEMSKNEKCDFITHHYIDFYRSSVQCDVLSFIFHSACVSTSFRTVPRNQMKRIHLIIWQCIRSFVRSSIKYSSSHSMQRPENETKKVIFIWGEDPKRQIINMYVSCTFIFRSVSLAEPHTFQPIVFDFGWAILFRFSAVLFHPIENNTKDRNRKGNRCSAFDGRAMTAISRCLFW